MATEKLLIDANRGDIPGIESTNSKYILGFDNGLIDVMDKKGNIICTFNAKDIPTVDAVEVVRCKDCQKWYRHTEVDRERGDCRRYQTTKHETGYCDRGERKDNE